MARYYSGPTQPLGTWNNIPIYLATILTAALGVGFIGSVILVSAGGESLLSLLIFSIPMMPSWSVWRLFTYVLVDQIDFFTPFSIAFFYWFAAGIETHLGRPVLVRLLISLLLVPVAFGAVLWWGREISTSTAGIFLLTSGMLVAFATLYPNTEAWGWIPFRWMAFACIFCGSLMLLRRPIELAELWASCAVGFVVIRQSKEAEYDDYESPLLRVKQFFRKKPKLRVMPPPPVGSRYRDTPPAAEPASELDALLDKIAKSGMASLTAKEKAQLERAREALLRKDQR
jgi:hypothetical protein